MYTSVQIYFAYRVHTEYSSIIKKKKIKCYDGVIIYSEKYIFYMFEKNNTRRR